MHAVNYAIYYDTHTSGVLAQAEITQPGSRLVALNHRSFKNSDPGVIPVTINRSLARVQAT